MPSSLKNIMIGIFVLAALSIIVFMLLFLHPSVGDNAKTLRIRFTDIDKVNIGTRVTLAGHPVGEVISIEELPDARDNRQSINGDVYVYELVATVDSSVDVFNTDEVLLRTSGLLGERNIEINPRPLKPGEKLIKVDNQIIYAETTPNVEDTLKQFSELSKKFGEILNEIQNEKIVAKVSHSIQNIVEITDALNQPDKWRQTVDNIFTLSSRANQSWNTVDNILKNSYALTEKAHQSWHTVDDSLNQFDTSAKNVVAFTEKANHLIDLTSHGKGTLGQLLVGDDLYLRLKSIFHRGEVTMGDINSYGVLFHLDKRWQRLQGKRLRLLEKLSSPCEFTQYFNHEVDEINTSLSRVAHTLNESDNCPESLINNPSFTQRFSELLRRVENLDETLKLYNEQVVESENKSLCSP